MAVKLIIDGAKMHEMLHGKDGAVGKWMFGRAQVVQMAAIAQCPKRTNKLSESIVKRMYETPGGLDVVIAAQQPYALYVHEGTKPHTILPKKAGGVLHFMIDGQDVFARSVNHPGTKANKFLTDNLRLFNAV